MIASLVIAGFQRLEEKPRLAGVLLAVAACVKPQALILAPVVLWGRWATVKAAVLAGLALCAASLAMGPHLWIDWFRILPRFADLVEPTVPKISPGYLVPGLPWRLALGAAGLAFAWRERGIAGLLVGTLLCTPYVQLYDLAGFSYLGARLVRDAKRAPAAVVVFGAALTVCAAWPLLTTAYCAGLAAVAEWRRRKPAMKAPAGIAGMEAAPKPGAGGGRR
jgi:hypothetical protein